MELFLTGGSGVLGRALEPLAGSAGHTVRAPSHRELDLYDPEAVARAVSAVDAVLHLATRIPPTERFGQAEAWEENDRLRTECARLLVDAALDAGVATFVQPTIAFVYPQDAPADEDTPVGEVSANMRSALVAEQETARFAAAGSRGVVLRLGLLDGPGTGHGPLYDVYGTTLHVADAASSLLAALSIPSGIYNVCRDGERISNERFKRVAGWRPRH
ncbi:MAG: NAD-dependent epimerase/dehydratase family protein [Solirubrobacteraceae bacterium]